MAHVPTPKQQFRMSDDTWEKFITHCQDVLDQSGATVLRAFCEEVVTGSLDDAAWLAERLASPAAPASVGGETGDDGGGSG